MCRGAQFPDEFMLLFLFQWHHISAKEWDRDEMLAASIRDISTLFSDTISYQLRQKAPNEMLSQVLSWRIETPSYLPVLITMTASSARMLLMVLQFATSAPSKLICTRLKCLWKRVLERCCLMSPVSMCTWSKTQPK